jgi:hypothetical protein
MMRFLSPSAREGIPRSLNIFLNLFVCQHPGDHGRDHPKIEAEPESRLGRCSARPVEQNEKRRWASDHLRICSRGQLDRWSFPSNG